MKNEFNDWKKANKTVIGGSILAAGLGAAAAGKKMHDDNVKKRENAKRMEDMYAKMDRIEANTSKKWKWPWS